MYIIKINGNCDNAIVHLYSFGKATDKLLLNDFNLMSINVC